LFLGDFNTRGMVEYRNDPASQYVQLMAALNEARPDGIVDVWPALMGDANGGTREQESADIGRRIDYVFLANPGNAARGLAPKTIRVELYQDTKVEALSDHNAVVATFAWKVE
jgi:endonuclease/exonuclease/phosphatase family metal-dependent hydrolase